MRADQDAPALAWPRKTRELRNHHMDSTIWDSLRYREGDIVVATYGKSGTTWVQQLVAQMLFGGDPEVSVAELSPWVELRVPPPGPRLAMLEAQGHRRILKTHLPLDALPFSPKARYLYVGRDGRDVLLSWHRHHREMKDLFYLGLNGFPGREGPALEPPDPDVRRYFRTWLERDGHPFWPFWDHIRGWWAARELPNVRLLHFDTLKSGLEAEARRLAAFLEIEVSEQAWPRILEHSSFRFMKAHAGRVAPMGGQPLKGGPSSFLHRGDSGRWREQLGDEEAAGYERRALDELGPEAARWLETGDADLPW